MYVVCMYGFCHTTMQIRHSYVYTCVHVCACVCLCVCVSVSVCVCAPLPVSLPLPPPHPIGCPGPQAGLPVRQKLPSSYLFYTRLRTYVKATFSVRPTFSFPHYPQVCFPLLHLHSFPANRFISTVFLDSIHMCVCVYVIIDICFFLFLTLFTLYKKL